MKARTRSAVATALAPGARYDDDVARGLPVHAAESAVGLGAELDAADVADAQQRGVRPRAQDDVLELAADPPAAPARVTEYWKSRARERRRLADEFPPGSAGSAPVWRC